MVDMVAMVDIAESAFVAVVAAPEMVDMVDMVDIAGSVFVGTADVDRHRLVVPWLPSYTVGQLVVGFLNSRSCLG